MPMPLLARAATRPAICVPCQLLLAASSPGPHWLAVVQSPGSDGSASRPSPSRDSLASAMKS